jgi:predicted kinase
MLVVFRGLPGTGKSYLVKQLVAARPGFLVLSRDALRPSLIPHPSFSAEEKSLVDDLIVSMTGFLLDRGRDIVIDGMALSSSDRVEQLAACADSRHLPVAVIECVCSEATALSRIEGDADHPAGDRGEALYREVKRRFQPLARPSLVVDTEPPTSGNLERILVQLYGVTNG